MTANTRRIGVIGSAGGSAFFAAHEIYTRYNGDTDFFIIADRDCGLLSKAKEKGLNNKLIPYLTKEQFSIDAHDYLRGNNVESVVLIYSRLVGDALFRGLPTFNVHPSLLPAFPGMKAVERAHAANVQVMGATLHMVDHSVDGGPIINQCWDAVPENSVLQNLERISFVHKTWQVLCFMCIRPGGAVVEHSATVTRLPTLEMPSLGKLVQIVPDAMLKDFMLFRAFSLESD